MEMPKPHATVIIYLRDGTKSFATWTGKVWWERTRERASEDVVRWEPFPPDQWMTYAPTEERPRG